LVPYFRLASEAAGFGGRSMSHEKYQRLIDAAAELEPAKVPIILTSRAGSVTTRLASCAVAALVARARREGIAKAIAG
jgi:hypothetical protein